MTRPGLMPLRASYPRPHFSSVPGLKFSTTTSASKMRRRARSCPSSSRRLMVTDFLLRAIMGHQRVCPSLRWRPHTRMGSPLPGGSSFMTWAPKSARSWPQKGPASKLPISTTRTPSRGRAPLLPSAIHILLEGSYDEVAALIDVLAHDDFGPVSVAFLQSFQDLAVIVVGDDPLVRRVPVEGLEHERNLDGAIDEALEALVAARLHDGPVELLIQRDEGTDLLLVILEPAGQSLHLPGQFPQPLQLTSRHASRRAPRRVALQYGAQVVDVPHVLDGEGAHRGPAVRRDLDESLSLEHGEGLPHRRPAHPEPLRKLFLDQTFIRTILARQDQSPQPLQNLDGPRPLPRATHSVSHSNLRFPNTENPLYTILGAHESCVKNFKAIGGAQASSAVLPMSRCQGVRISHPLDVTAMVCSYWAESLLSAVTTVQPSFRKRISGVPSLIIGSMVNVMPARKRMPRSRRPKWFMWGSSCSAWPTPWSPNSRTTP